MQREGAQAARREQESSESEEDSTKAEEGAFRDFERELRETQARNASEVCVLELLLYPERGKSSREGLPHLKSWTIGDLKQRLVTRGTYREGDQWKLLVKPRGGEEALGNEVVLGDLDQHQPYEVRLGRARDSRVVLGVARGSSQT